MDEILRRYANEEIEAALRIPKVSIQYDDNLFEEVCGYEKYIPVLNSADDTFEFEGKIMMNPSKVFYYLLGRSNNWLKMHGYPMIRKVRR